MAEPGRNPAVAALEAFLRQHGQRGAQRTWLAVSGGADSMALLHAAQAVDGRFGVLHVDHGLRPESDADRAFVEAETLALGMAFEGIRLDGLADSEMRTSHGVEAAARHARYAWMAQVAGEHGLVLTAHHADDQRETRLLHLLRGSRAEALAGMSALHHGFGCAVGRPFLSLTKRALVEGLVQSKASWREDPSNRLPDFLRNRIRHELIPVLDDIRPGWEAGLERMGQVASEWGSFMAGFLSGPQMETAAFPLELLRTCPSPLHALGLWGQAFGFGPAQAEALALLAAADTEVGRKRCSGTHCIVREREALVAQPVEAENDRAPRSWEAGNGSADAGAIDTPDGTLTWHIAPWKASDNPDPDDAVGELWLTHLHWPLTLRPWSDGDRMAPLGMEGSQLVSDILTQRKVPAGERHGQWVIEEAHGRIAWLVGHRLHRGAAVPGERQAGHVLRLRWRANR